MILESLIKQFFTLQCLFVVHCDRYHIGSCADRGFVVVYSGENGDAADDYDNDSDDDFVLTNGQLVELLVTVVVDEIRNSTYLEISVIQ